MTSCQDICDAAATCLPCDEATAEVLVRIDRSRRMMTKDEVAALEPVEWMPVGVDRG